MNSTVQYHRGALLQKGRGVGGIFNSLFRTLLPIGKALVKSTPTILRNTAKGPIGRKFKKSAKKIALNTAKNLMKSGNIDKTIQKSLQDSKEEIANILESSNRKKKRKSNSIPNCKPRKYHFMR